MCAYIQTQDETAARGPAALRSGQKDWTCDSNMYRGVFITVMSGLCHLGAGGLGRTAGRQRDANVSVRARTFSYNDMTQIGSHSK